MDLTIRSIKQTPSSFEVMRGEQLVGHLWRSQMSGFTVSAIPIGKAVGRHIGNATDVKQGMELIDFWLKHEVE